MRGRYAQERREADISQRRSNEGSEEALNTRLDSKTVRAIDFYEDDGIEDAGLKVLILDAVRLNTLKKREQ